MYRHSKRAERGTCPKKRMPITRPQVLNISRSVSSDTDGGRFDKSDRVNLHMNNERTGMQCIDRAQQIRRVAEGAQMCEKFFEPTTL
jgi:hypothetical protein